MGFLSISDIRTSRIRVPDVVSVCTSRAPITLKSYCRVRLDSANCEIPKFVSCGGPVATTVRNNPRRCCRTSTSSGYSSHSPPLSAGSYSYYASATSALTSTSTSTKDPYSGLTVIHESETIPRPVWPSPVIYHRIEDRSADYKGRTMPSINFTPNFRKRHLSKLHYRFLTGIYTCRVCNCAYSCPLPSPPVSPPPTASARETLLQLSRTINSVINGDVATTPEDILRDISRIISLGIGSKDDGIYECVYPWTLDDKNLSATSSYVKNVPSRVNPVNSRLYGGTRCLYGHNSARLLVKDERMRCEKNGETSRWTRENSGVTLRPYETSCPYVCKYLNGSHNGNNAKLSLRLENDAERRGDGVASTGSKYSAVSTRCILILYL